jgi:hypothetical protein
VVKSVACRVKYANLCSASSLLAESKHRFIPPVTCLLLQCNDGSYLGLRFVTPLESMYRFLYGRAFLTWRISCPRLQISLDRQKAIRVSGMSEKAYVRSLTAMQNALGLR